MIVVYYFSLCRGRQLSLYATNEVCWTALLYTKEGRGKILLAFMHSLHKKQDLWRPPLKETHREGNEKHNTDLAFPWVCLLLNTKEPITTSITVASPAAFVLKPDELYWFGKIVQLLGKLDSSLFTTIHFFLMKRQLVNIQLTGQLKASLAAFLFPASIVTVSPTIDVMNYIVSIGNVTWWLKNSIRLAQY